jgi:hypothetical protein
MIDTRSADERSVDGSKNNIAIPRTFTNQKVNQLHEDVDVDRYMSLVSSELQKLGYSLDKRAFIANIITILDKLIEPKKFNKTIFFHILDYANLNRESLILLLDFFRSFFIVYESMKRNKTRLVGEINEFKRKIDTLKNKALVQKSTEKILENGLTNNSRIKVKAVNINIDYFSNQNEKNISLNNVNVSSAKLKFTFGNYTQEIDSSTLNRKIVFDLTDMSQLDNPLRIYLINRNQEIFVDKISVREILEVSCERRYCFENVAFDLNLVWVNSKVNFYNKEIARIEAMLSENKESVDVLINSIGHIEGTRLLITHRNL